MSAQRKEARLLKHLYRSAKRRQRPGYELSFKEFVRSLEVDASGYENSDQLSCAAVAWLRRK